MIIYFGVTVEIIYFGVTVEIVSIGSLAKLYMSRFNFYLKRSDSPKCPRYGDGRSSQNV